MNLRFLSEDGRQTGIDVPARTLLKIVREFKREMPDAQRMHVNNFFYSFEFAHLMPRGFKPDEVNQQQFYGVKEIEAILNREKAVAVKH